MTKRIRILAIITAVSVILIVFCIITVNNFKAEQNQKLILKTKGTHLALYKGQRIVEVYDEIDVRRLTDYDRHLLNKGITIESESELLAILEDYD